MSNIVKLRKSKHVNQDRTRAVQNALNKLQDGGELLIQDAIVMLKGVSVPKLHTESGNDLRRKTGQMIMTDHENCSCDKCLADICDGDVWG